MMLNSQKSMIDQFYRTSTAGFGAKAQGFQTMGGAGAMSRRDTSQSDKSNSGYEEEEEEEEDSGDDKKRIAVKNQRVAWH